MRSGQTFAFDSPEAALRALLERLEPVETESVPLADAAGRVLAADVLADRPSPPCDVSAMDGYVLRLADLERGELSVSGEVRTGHAPGELPENAVMRVFTGGAVPAAGEAVIPREQLVEEPGRIRWDASLAVVPGQHIRRRGENVAAGEVVIERGVEIGPQVVSALAAYGHAGVDVRRRVRVSVLVTGDELVEVGETPGETRIRDSNGPALGALLLRPWVEVSAVLRVEDDPDALERLLRGRLEGSDAVLLSGGVSMGDYDFVEGALGRVGAETVFHRLPIRPGKPLLAAIGPEGRLVLGLPGNPMSVLVTARRFGIPALRKLAGVTRPVPPVEQVTVANPDESTLGLHWHRPARRVGPGLVDLVECRGSGDIAALARSDGFVCVAPGRFSRGPLPFFSWGG